MAGESEVTRIMMGVNESTIKGYPHASISSKGAFEWTLKKIVRSNFSGFKLLFLYVQVPDEDDASNGGSGHSCVMTCVLHVPSMLPFLHLSYVKGFDDMDSVYASPDDFKRMNCKDMIRGLHLLEYFVNRCHELGVPCDAWLKKGDPKEVICHEVNRVQPDLLVVGSRGLGPFQKVFVGTVSEFCAKHADCPVITIKRKADEAPQDPVDD